MVRVRLIHWNAAEAQECLNWLRKSGFEPEFDAVEFPELNSKIKAVTPSAFVIDLSRLPSHGQSVAAYLRKQKTTRHIPIVFAGGEPEKIEKVRQALPDALYTPWPKIKTALRQAIAQAPESPVIPRQAMEGYQDRTAALKLGIREGSTVALIDPPGNYRQVLGELPPEVILSEEEAGSAPVTLCFVRDAASLPETLLRLRPLASRTKLWFLWPKQTSGSRGGVTQNLMRDQAAALGLTSYKICAVDRTWSGMLFSRKS